MNPKLRENLGMGIGLAGMGLTGYGLFGDSAKYFKQAIQTPKPIDQIRKEYNDRKKALENQEDAEIKRQFPKYYKLNQQWSDANAEKSVYLDMDIDEGHPLWSEYDKAWDKEYELREKLYNAADKYGPQGLTALKDKYKKLRDANQQAYNRATSRGVDVDSDPKYIGAMLGGFGLMGIAAKMLNKTASDNINKRGLNMPDTKSRNNNKLKPEERVGAAVGGLFAGQASLSASQGAFFAAHPELWGSVSDPQIRDLITYKSKADYDADPRSFTDMLNDRAGKHSKAVQQRVKTTAKKLGLDIKDDLHYVDKANNSRDIYFRLRKGPQSFMTPAEMGVEAVKKVDPKYYNAVQDRINHTGRNVVIGDNKFMNSRGAIAHEFGHARQNKHFITANIAGKKLLPVAMLGGAIHSAYDNDSNGGIGYGIATAGGLATLANELDASYKGSKAFKSLRGKASVFKGIPTYAGLAAAPAVAYGATKYFKNRMRKEKTTKLKEYLDKD